MADRLVWLKRLMLPAAKAHVSRKATALALITAAISGFKFVKPIDHQSAAFRYVLLAGGAIGVIWLIALIVFPPETKK